MRPRTDIAMMVCTGWRIIGVSLAHRGSTSGASAYANYRRYDDLANGVHEALNVEIGDFADVAVEGSYPLVFIVWNSFYNLLTQADQLRCFCQCGSAPG